MARLKTVMVIDDDDDDRELFQNIIERIKPPLECESAVNGIEALDKLQNTQPDVVFLDLNMPLMDGKQLLREMKKSDDLKNIPVAVLSTSSDPHTIKEVLSLGASYFITKPDRIKLWEAEIQKVLKALFSPAV